MLRAPGVVLVIVLGTLLSACGGGGGGGGSTPPPGSTSPPPASPPPPPPVGSAPPAPALPTIQYTGSTEPALLDERTAGPFAEALAGSFYLVEALAEDFLFGVFADRGEIDQRGPGPEGGSLRISGFITNDDTGWLQFEFDEFQEAGTVIDGRVVQEILVAADRPQPRIRAAYHAYRLRVDGEDFQLTGTVDRRISLFGDERLPATTEVNLLVTDNITGETLFLDRVNMLREAAILAESGLFLSQIYQADGTLALGEEGTVTIVREGGLYFAPDEFGLPDWPWGGEPIELRGADESRLRLSGLRSDFAAVELWTPGIGYDRSARIVRGEEPWLAGSETETLQANAGRDITILPGRDMTLDARQTRQATGRFASHEWRLLLAPPGSDTVLAQPRQAVQQFSAFAEGVYLFELSSRIDQDISVDTFRVTVTRTFAPTRSGADQAVAGPDLHITINQPVALDGRGSERADFSPPFYEWRQRPLDNNVISLSDAAAPQPSLIAQRPGFTEVLLLPRPGDSDFADRVTLYVDSPVAFTGHADLFTTAGPDNVKDVAWGDVTGNGRPDLVTVGLDVASDAPVLRVYPSIADGRFGAPVVYDAPAGAALALADLDGDGRLDVVMRNLSGFEFRLQQADGSLGSPQRLAHALSCTEDTDWDGSRSLVGVFGVGDFDGDGRADLVHVVQCTEGGIELRHQQADGSFGPSLVYPLPSPGRLAIGDLDDNGLTDLAVVADDTPGTRLLRLALGQPDRSLDWLDPLGSASIFGAPTISPLDGAPALLIGRAGGPGSTPPATEIYTLTANQTVSRREVSPAGPALASLGAFAGSIDVVDVDGDGLDDLVWQTPTQVLMQRGLPNGDFAPPVAIPLLTANSGGIAGSRYLWADVDGDGRLDVIYADTTGREIDSQLRRGVGGFRLQTPVPAALNPISQRPGD